MLQATVRWCLLGRAMEASLLADQVVPACLERVLSHSFASSSGSSRAARTTSAWSSTPESDQWVTSGPTTSDAPSPTKASKVSDRNLKAAHPQLVEQLLAPANMSHREQLMQRKPAIIQQFQRTPSDLGSPEVQIALLTDRIRDMAVHVLANKQDHVSKRGLQGILNQRRKLLAYLRRSNFTRYCFVIHQLGLKDVYAKQARYDKYRVGSRLGRPAEALKRYGDK